jgi:neutral ceramidase
MPTSAMAVSTAKLDITPTLTMNPYMGGYGTDNGGRKATTGTPYADMPLYARCTVLWDNGRPKAIATADVLAFPRSMHQNIAHRVQSLNTSWAPSDFVLTATHTHNGPALIDVLNPYIAYGLTDLTPLANYSKWLQDQMVAVVNAALNAPQTPCALDYQVITQNFSYNRENLPYVETAVPMLVARAPGGEPVAVLFGYGTHPVSAGLQTQFDGDYAAEAVSWVEDTTGAFAQFLLGPAGDQDPVGSPRDFDLRNQLGSQLGHAVIAAVARAGRPATGPILTSYQEVSLPLDITDTPENLAAVRAAYVARLSNSALPPWFARHASVMIKQIDFRTFQTAVPLPTQVWTLQGNPLLRIALTGGELVSGYAVYFRNLYGGPNGLWIGSYANEVPAYVPSNELLPPIRIGGSYAGGWDIDYPGIAGGSMTVYAHLSHCLADPEGVESTLIAALSEQLGPEVEVA